MAVSAIYKILTLFFDELGAVSLQYHPSALSMTTRSQAHNIVGLENILTFISPEETQDIQIRISAYYTALIPKEKDDAMAPKIIGALSAVAGAGMFAAGKQVLDAFETAAGVISLGKGVYDIASGFVSNVPFSMATAGLAKDQFNKLKTLHEANRLGKACEILWDIEHEVHKKQKYILTEIDSTVESIREDDGASMIVRIDMTLINEGARVEIR
jgi:hypothetical protein